MSSVSEMVPRCVREPVSRGCLQDGPESSDETVFVLLLPSCTGDGDGDGDGDGLEKLSSEGRSFALSLRPPPEPSRLGRTAHGRGLERSCAQSLSSLPCDDPPRPFADGAAVTPVAAGNAAVDGGNGREDDGSDDEDELPPLWWLARDGAPCERKPPAPPVDWLGSPTIGRSRGRRGGQRVHRSWWLSKMLTSCLGVYENSGFCGTAVKDGSCCAAATTALDVGNKDIRTEQK